MYIEKEKDVVLLSLFLYDSIILKKEVKTMSICDTCINYEYDEDYECYTCMMDLDEDEYEKFITNRNTSCPYYQNGDEYLVVRKQM